MAKQGPFAKVFTVGLLALVILSPVFVLPVAYSGIAGPGILARFAIGGLLLAFVVVRQHWPRTLLAYGLAVYGAVLLLTTATSVDPYLSLQGHAWRMTGVYDQLLWLLFAGMLPAIVRDHWRLLLYVGAAVGGLLGLSGILEHLLWPQDAFAGRVSGFAGNPGVLAVSLMCSVPVAIWLASGSVDGESGPCRARDEGWVVRRAQRGLDALCYAIAALALVALHLTSTRAALLGAVAAIAIVGVGYRRARVPAVSAITLLVVWQALFGLAGGDSRTIIPNASEGAIQHRSELQAVGWQAFLDRPWLGWGPSTFIHADERYGSNLGQRADTPHNMLLQVAVEQGVLGVFALAFVGIAAVRALWRQQEWWALAVLTALSVYGLAWFASPHMYVWVALVLGFAMHAEQRVPTMNQPYQRRPKASASFFDWK